jgi:hypothetical protein
MTSLPGWSVLPRSTLYYLYYIIAPEGVAGIKVLVYYLYTGVSRETYNSINVLPASLRSAVHPVYIMGYNSTYVIRRKAPVMVWG